MKFRKLWLVENHSFILNGLNGPVCDEFTLDDLNTLNLQQHTRQGWQIARAGPSGTVHFLLGTEKLTYRLSNPEVVGAQHRTVS